MNTEDVQSQRDRLSLPIRGASVVQCCVDNALTLKFDLPDAQLRLESSFTIRDENGREALIPSEGDATRFGPVLKLWGARILEAIATEGGGLTLHFEGGGTLQASPDPHYESWELAGPSGLKVIALPGGGLATWGVEVEKQE
jgi:Family of unknown function (DUF6188)